jgi:xanthine dehydrogenase YagS FAD-binding subunit
MKGFDLHEPTTITQAVGLLDQLGVNGKVLAGGSDLVGGIFKDWVTGKGMPLPSALVDITTIPDLKGIKSGGTGISIGAATTLTEIIESADVQKSIPLLAEAAKTIASPLIRNFGTLGGNINQRPRCWFFRGEDFNCYKKGGDFCYSVTGDNRYHAVIGGELCYIVHPSDTATALGNGLMDALSWAAWRPCRTEPRSSRRRSKVRTSKPWPSKRRRRFGRSRGRCHSTRTRLTLRRI